MSTQTLSARALTIIQDYLALPFTQSTASVACPYINNRRHAVRGALRVAIGKGSPKEIVEEAELLARKERIQLAALAAPALKQFLVEHNLGVDCAGLVYHILDAELASRGRSLKRRLRFPLATNPLRALLARFRTAENTNVETLAHDINSSPVPLAEVQPGDLIIIRGHGHDQNRYHILIIHSLTLGHALETIAYTHSWQAPIDGKYIHGVRQGMITIIDYDKTLLDQRWLEQPLWREAKSAKSVAIRRLKFLSS